MTTGSSRLLAKLNEAVQTKQFYEAHQLLKTLHFRYCSVSKYAELEVLLLQHAEFLLENHQYESGMDVAIMWSNLHKTAQSTVTEGRIDAALKLLKMMPASPERGQFIHHTLEWGGSSELCDKLHVQAAQLYIEVHGYDDAWRHILRFRDGKRAAEFTMQIIHGLGQRIHREELGLITAHLVVTFLVGKKVFLAEEALRAMLQTQDFHHLSPLLNGVRYLIEAAKANDNKAFQAIQTLYDMSFGRDPNLRKLVVAAGKSLFNLSDERAQGRGGGGFMSILGALMNQDSRL